MPLPFRLDHVNLWLLEDGDAYLLVDTGLATREVRALWSQVLGSLDKPVRRIIVTHFHPDHLGLAAWLQEQTGAALLMSHSEYLSAHCLWNEIGGFGTAAMLKQFRGHGLDEERLSALGRYDFTYRRGVPVLPQQHQRLMDHDRLTIGGFEWTIVAGFGHSPEHLSLYCDAKKLLISGDMLLPTISTNVSVFAVTPEIDALGLYLDSLDRFAHLPAECRVLPSHGLPFTGIVTRIEAQKAHHRQRLMLLCDACAASWHNAADLLPVLFEQELDTHQLMFALGETIAHLNHLERRGVLMCDKNAEGVIRYRLNDNTGRMNSFFDQQTHNEEIDRYAE